MIITPTRNDVLCGKDKACLQAEGSVRFREIIDSFLPKYLKCRTKFEKMTMTKEIYEIVSRDARFLKLNEKNGCWEEISAMAARDKIGHSLRFSNRAKRRHLKKKQMTQNAQKRSEPVPSSSSSSPAAKNQTNPFATESSLQKSISDQPLMEELASCSSLSSLFMTSNTSSSSAAPASYSSNLSSEFLGHLGVQLNQKPEVDTSNYNSMDDLSCLVGKGTMKPSFSKLLNDVMNLLQAVEESKLTKTTTGTSNLIKGGTKEDDPLMSLLSEPMGDWEEDRSIELPVVF